MEHLLLRTARPIDQGRERHGTMEGRLTRTPTSINDRRNCVRGSASLVQNLPCARLDDIGVNSARVYRDRLFFASPSAEDTRSSRSPSPRTISRCGHHAKFPRSCACASVSYSPWPLN